MVDGSEESYLYMKGRSRPFYALDSARTVSGKLPSSRIPKKVNADTQSSPTRNVRAQGPKAVAEHSSSPIVPQSMEAPFADPFNYDECVAFDLYEQDPVVDFECEDYNLRRKSSEFRLNFEDMIVLPIRLKKPSTFIDFDTPPATDVDEFDYADQHVYYSQLITTVNSNSARHEYGTRKGPLWDSAWEMLIPKGLHPAYLTEAEFVKLVLSQGNDTAKWMDVNIPILYRRAFQKATAARQKLSDAGISPFEMTKEYLESFEWMDKIEQDNFVKNMQTLQLQVAFQKRGISMRVEDIDDTTPVDDETLIGKCHTKLVKGMCTPQDHSSGAEADELFMVDTMSLSEFEDQFWNDDHKKASIPSSSVPIQQTNQSPTAHIPDAFLWKGFPKSSIHSRSTDAGPPDKSFEHIKNPEVCENSDDAHQDTKTTYTIENGNLTLSHLLSSSTSKSCTCCSGLPTKNLDTHVVFSLQDPPPISPTRSALDGYISDGSESPGSTEKGIKHSGHGSQMKRSSGSQSSRTGKSDGVGMSGRFDALGKKLGDSPRSLKKKLSSVFGTIGRSGRNKYQHVSLND